MHYDQFLNRLARININRSQFARQAGIRPSTTYNWRRVGIPPWGQFILHQQELIAFHHAAIKQFIALAEQGRIAELKTHGQEIMKCLP